MDEEFSLGPKGKSEPKGDHEAKIEISPPISKSESGKEKPNKILLCCFLNKFSRNVPLDYFYSVFSKHGKVLKVLIFERARVWKLFVEMATLEEAMTVKSKLNNQALLDESSKMNIHFSNLNELSFPEKSPSGKVFPDDYKVSSEDINSLNKPEFEKIIIRGYPDMHINTKSSSFSEFNEKTPEINYQLREQLTDSSGHSPESERNQALLQRSISMMSKYQDIQEPPGLSQTIAIQRKKLMNADYNNPSASRTPEITTAINNQSISPVSSSLVSNSNLPFNHNKNSELSYVLENKKSSVLFVKGIDNPAVQAYMIFNLFSNFGNVLKVVLIRSKKSALVEFQSVEFATLAKDFLNNLKLKDCLMRIFYSNHQEIMINNKRPSQEIDPGKEQGEDVLVASLDRYRFKKNKPVSINPPSQVLHVSNISKDICNDLDLRRIFSAYGKVEELKINHESEEKKMCFVKFSSLEDSFICLAELHDKEFNGRRIKVSFTKSKI